MGRKKTNTTPVELDYCSGCGHDKDVKKDFYKSNNPAHKGHTIYCKPCIRGKIYRDDNKIDKQKMKDTLKEMDLPWIEETYQTALASSYETFGKYISLLNTVAKAKGRSFLTWEDSDEFQGKKEVPKKNNIVDIEIESDFIINEEIIKFWGKGFELDDYEFLEEYYYDLIRIYDHSTPVQINLYKNMAKTQLLANKCLSNADNAGYEKNMKLLSTLQNDANIKPVQETSAGNIDKGSFGVFIKKIENEEPIPRWTEDLGKEDKLEKYIKTFFFGNLARVLNIRNPWQEEIDDEMKQFTVEKSDVDVEKSEDLLGDS